MDYDDNAGGVTPLVSAGVSYVKKNYRNHIYFSGMALFEYEDCQINKNLVLGICGDLDEDGDGLSYVQELDKQTFPFDRDTDHEGIPYFMISSRPMPIRFFRWKVQAVSRDHPLLKAFSHNKRGGGQ